MKVFNLTMIFILSIVYSFLWGYGCAQSISKSNQKYIIKEDLK